MQSKADTVNRYLAELPPDRQPVMEKLRNTFKKNLPKGFAEGMGYGMVGWSVPHKLFPQGYHCDPKQPLPFIGIAAQKNFYAVYHMGMYADAHMTDWFTKAYAELGIGKLDMGKSCIRFKNPDKIPYKLLEELAKKMTPQDWIDKYTSVIDSRTAKKKA